MINKLRYIFEVTHENDYKINLDKIIRQKNYNRFDFNENEINITRYDLDKLEENKLIMCIKEDSYIISPLGYALLVSDADDFDDKTKFSIMVQVYDAMHKQLADKYNINKLSNLECSLGFFILLNGGTSKDNSIPFTKTDNIYSFFNIIENNFNKLSFRLFYNSESQIHYLKDHIHLRNILGRNNKNGNLKKHTNYHSISSVRGKGTTYHWFEIENEDGSIDEQKLNFILDRLLANNKSLITLLNLKKIALNNSLINELPYDWKKMIGNQSTRAEVLQKIINYTDSNIEEYYTSTKKVKQSEMFKFLKEIQIKPTSSLYALKEFYKEISNIIENYSEIGIFLIEVHYRIEKVMVKLDELDLNVDIKNAKVYQFEDVLESDFYDILNENLHTCVEYLNSIKL